MPKCSHQCCPLANNSLICSTCNFFRFVAKMCAINNEVRWSEVKWNDASGLILWCHCLFTVSSFIIRPYSFQQAIPLCWSLMCLLWYFWKMNIWNKREEDDFVHYFADLSGQLTLAFVFVRSSAIIFKSAFGGLGLDFLQQTFSKTRFSNWSHTIAGILLLLILTLSACPSR